MRSSALSNAAWRKSSRSNDGGNADCVEVAEMPGRVALRDSKDPAGPVLVFHPEQWRLFLSTVRANHFT
ncbi:MAG: DUF397 domain-containing protein [Nocardioidaceae bacterium]